MIQRSFASSVVLLALALGRCGAAEPFHPVQCDGAYPKHLQGICTNDVDVIYWSFTTTLVKTDTNGKVLEKVTVADHHGDLCFHEGKLYVAVNLGEFNLPAGKAESWVYVYDAGTLREIARHQVPEVVHGAGGIAVRDGRFFVVGGLPPGIKENTIYEYDAALAFQQRHVLTSGATFKGIQTIASTGDCWWFGCYGAPRVLIQADKQFNMLGKWNFESSLGIAAVPNKRLLVARGAFALGNGYTGRVVVAIGDGKNGLRVIEPAE